MFYLGSTERNEVTVGCHVKMFRRCYEIKEELVKELLNSDDWKVNKQQMLDKYNELTIGDLDIK